MKADVVVMGGGLAGLTLALQLRQQMPALDILVIERNRHPVPAATHKVGESSVEIGAHYFDTVLGLRTYLDAEQIRKFGFRFFFSDGRRDIDRVLEVGASRHLGTPSYQLDRGLFENFLGQEVRRRGIRFTDGAVIRRFTLGEQGGEHSVEFEHDGVEHGVRARWLIDACGRVGMIKRRLNLALDNGHEATAVWFRVGQRIDVNHWSADAQWLGRCDPPDRWRSTNHLVGPGYWAWLIPLASGSHSVGIVADARMHPTEQMNSFDKAMAWFHIQQPRLAEALEGMRDSVQDFAWLRRFSYGCKQVFSADRWALTGESGVFLDPFYSPGSDFIAIANTYIADLVARDMKGKAIEARASIYEKVFLSFYDSMLSIYLEQYKIFGSATVLPVKIIWDYTYYWGVLCQLFFQRRLTDMVVLGTLREALLHAQQLNFAMQSLLRQWAALDTDSNQPGMFDQAKMDWFAELNRGLTDTLDDAQFKARMRQTTDQMHALAAEIAHLVRARGLKVDLTPLMALIDTRAPVTTRPLLGQLHAHWPQAAPPMAAAAGL